MSGMALMGDPQASWGSIPTLLAYMFLPLNAATAATLVAQMALAALGTLLFLRSTGASYAASTLGALSYGIGGKIFASQGWLALIGRMAWLPWLFLGIDLASHRRGRLRLLGWVLFGFAAS
ncbi:MAG: hypothetical protein M3328_14490, partial [Chloroflexota bacterium]|nr:hypothetical protein [Chloroflexota bacterium]